MKNIFKILSLVVFVLLMASCQKENDVLVQENETENQFKNADEDEFIMVDKPSILGQFYGTLEERALGIRIELICIENTYFKNSSIDENGNFSFFDLQPGTYNSNVIIGEEIVSITTYLVSY